MTASNADAGSTAAGGPSLPAGYEQVPYSFEKLRLRRRAAARAYSAAAAVPTLTADVQVELTSVLAVREEWNGATDRRPEDRLSALAFIATAAVAALADHPSLNATWTDDGILRWDTVNLGVAVDAPDGLAVPVIRDAQTLDARQIGAAVRELALTARSRGLSPESLAAGTFTISNPGAVGPSLRAEALLNPPQVALLGLPGVRRVPVVVEGPDGERIEPRSVLCPSLSFDHRALDGGEAIRFLVALRDRLESWRMDDYLRPQG